MFTILEKWGKVCVITRQLPDSPPHERGDSDPLAD